MSAERSPVRANAEAVESISLGPGQFRLRLRVAAWPGSLPGQFVMLSAGAFGGVDRTDPLLPRPMAIFRTLPADRGHTDVEVLGKVVGRGTALLADVLPGQRVRLVGPLGVPFPDSAPGTRRILVGGGTGIASLYDLAARSAECGSVVVILGARSAGELLARDEFAALDVSLRLATEDGGEGERGLVTDLLADELGRDSAATVYACGPTPMMERCAALAHAAGAGCLVSLENQMACGFGVCLGCAVPCDREGYALVCRDGPVFDARRLRWDGMP